MDPQENDSGVTATEWETAIGDLWNSFDDYDRETFRLRMMEVVGECPLMDGAALFEEAGMWDSTGRSDLAVPLYGEALERGLADDRRRRSIIQMASSMRNIGETEDAERLLRNERRMPSDELDDAIVAFHALVLADLGRETEALSMTLQVLAQHLPRYQRSLKAYAQELVESERSGG